MVTMKKVALPTEGDNLDAPIAAHFGRAENFLVYDLETQSFELYPNPEARGERVLPPHFLNQRGVDGVIAFGLGLPAFNLFKSLAFKMFKAISGSVRENLKALREGSLRELTAEDIA